MNASHFGVQRDVVVFESANMSARSKSADAKAEASLPTGKLSPLQEDESHYYATAVLSKTSDRVKLTTVEWRKEPLESWLARTGSQVPSGSVLLSANYTLPTISGGGCNDDAWTPTPGSPDARGGRTAVWTGGQDRFVVNTGGRYDPSTDSWIATSTTNAPDGRSGHTAVWTGSAMIVWGGYGATDSFNTGGRYDPDADSWTATNTANAPDPRGDHMAVWTDSQMVVWGGYPGLNTTGRYCAQSGSPTPTPTPTPTATATPTATVRPTPTPRIAPTPRARPTPAPRP